MLTAILIAISFGLLIFFHEFGHFIMARILKIKVLQFSFGLGKELFGKTIGETRYSVCVLPVGGAVKLKGENIEELNFEPDSFFGKKWYQRIFVVITGPLMNYILAAIIFVFLTYKFGVIIPNDTPVIGEVVKDKPAYKAGLQPRDKILKINNIEITTWSQMAQIIHKSAGVKLTIEILRENKKIIKEIIPERDPSTGKGIIGIVSGYEIKHVGFLKSIYIGFTQPIMLSVYTIKYLVEKIRKLEKPEIAGPVGILQILSKSAKSGTENFLYTVGMISTMLGLFNLLPIPILDGGHILFGLMEFVTNKTPSKKMYEIANIIGFSIILMLFFFATYSDILRIVTK